MNKKAQEQIITTVLLILIVLAAIVIVWAVVQRFVKSVAVPADIYARCLDVSLEFEERSVNCSGTNSAKTIIGTIKRGGDNIGNIKMKIAVKNASTGEVNAPNVLETQGFQISSVPANTDETVTLLVGAIIPQTSPNPNIVCPKASDEIKIVCS